MSPSLSAAPLPRALRRRSDRARALPAALLARLRRRLPSAALDFRDVFDFRDLAADAPNWLVQLTERSD